MQRAHSRASNRPSYVDPGAGAELIMNANWKPFDSQEVRTAVLHAINPWTLNQTFWNGQSSPTLGPARSLAGLAVDAG